MVRSGCCDRACRAGSRIRACAFRARPWPTLQTLGYPEGVYVDIYTPWGYESIMTITSKVSRLKRLSRIEGQVRGLGRMVEEDRYCIDIVTQIAAVQAALRRVEEDVLRDHISHCVAHALASGDT